MASQIVLITGANSGVGYATTKALLQAPEDFHVVMTGRDLAKVEAAGAEIRAAVNAPADKITTLQLDVTDEASIAKAAAAVKEKFGRLDVLVNNAGIEAAKDSTDLRKVFQVTLETNTIGPALVSAAFRPLLMAADHPQHLFVGSIVSSVGELTDPSSWLCNTDAGSVPYRASKAALNIVAMHEQLETKDTKLKVRILCPGFVVSNLRGPSEEARTGGGLAGDPAVSARLVLSILRGERDDDASKLIRSEGTAPW